MADPNSSFFFDYNSLMNDPNPSLANLNDPNASFNLPNDDFADIASSLFDDSMAWDGTNVNTSRDETAQFQGAGPSTSGRGGGGGDRPGFLNGAVNLPFWPPVFEPYQCTCCHVLREIIHSDVVGNCAAKMEIHGRWGIICHAILEIKDRASFVPNASQFHMIDFCRRSIDEVKQYLQDYCNEQQRAGLILVNDPLSTFYEALCVGFRWDQNVNNNNNDNNNNNNDNNNDNNKDNNNNQQPIFNNDNNNNNNNQQPIFPEPGEMGIAPQQEGAQVRAPRNLALQRERAGKLTLKDLEHYFHLPIEEAARALNLCPTVVKKVCRRFRINRWPHRKIKSYQRQITNLRTLLSSSDEQERIRAQEEIQRLEAQIANLRNNRNDQLVIQ